MIVISTRLVILSTVTFNFVDIGRLIAFAVDHTGIDMAYIYILKLTCIGYEVCNCVVYLLGFI